MSARASSAASRSGTAQTVTALGVARQILQTEGPAGFMRGWTAAYARAGPAFFIQMPVVEALRNAFGVGSL
eukprot:4109860-Prymnesium_polylepis.1